MIHGGGGETILPNGSLQCSIQRQSHNIGTEIYVIKSQRDEMRCGLRLLRSLLEMDESQIWNNKKNKRKRLRRAGRQWEAGGRWQRLSLSFWHSSSSRGLWNFGKLLNLKQREGQQLGRFFQHLQCLFREATWQTLLILSSFHFIGVNIKTPGTCLRATGAHGKTIIIFFSAERRGKAAATFCSAARQRANGTFLGRAARGASAKGICHGVFRSAAAKSQSDARRRKGAAPIPVEKSGGGAR